LCGRPRPGSITPDESERLGVIVSPSANTTNGAVGAAQAAAQTWQYLADALRLEAPTMTPAEAPGFHPTRAARLVGAGGQQLGAVGEVDPGVVEAYGLRARLGYLSLEVDALLSEPRRPRQARDVSRFPASDMDLAFTVPQSVPAAAVRATLRDAGGDLLEAVWLFDVYRGPQLGTGPEGIPRRSLAFRLRFRAVDRTLDEPELVRLRQRAIDAVVAAHAAGLRT
jgi:phenylalanyl-tRNA synthetase beta chain